MFFSRRVDSCPADKCTQLRLCVVGRTLRREIPRAGPQALFQKADPKPPSSLSSCVSLATDRAIQHRPRIHHTLNRGLLLPYVPVQQHMFLRKAVVKTHRDDLKVGAYRAREAKSRRRPRRPLMRSVLQSRERPEQLVHGCLLTGRIDGTRSIKHLFCEWFPERPTSNEKNKLKQNSLWPWPQCLIPM